MNRAKYTYIYIVLMSLIESACTNNTERNCAFDDAEPMAIERIDLFVTNYGIMSDTADNLQPGLDLYLALMLPEAANRDSALTVLHGSRVTRVFGHDIVEQFDFSDTLQRRLGSVKERLQSLLPEVRLAHVYGIASPYRQSVVISDSVALVALNHYLGPDYAGYKSMPDNQRALKQPLRIPLDVAEAMISTHYPYQPGQATLLEEMLYRGAVAVALEKITSGYHAADLLHISREQYDRIAAQDDERWDEMVTSDRLYDNNNLPAPVVAYYGYKIVKAYLKNNPETTVYQLLQPQFYHDSLNNFIKSRSN